MSDVARIKQPKMAIDWKPLDPENLPEGTCLFCSKHWETFIGEAEKDEDDGTVSIRCTQSIVQGFDETPEFEEEAEWHYIKLPAFPKPYMHP